MPFPTPQVGDAVAYVSNNGTTLFPATIISVDGSGVASLSVTSPTSQFDVVGGAHDETRAQGGSWSWPTNTGAGSGQVSSQSGNSYSVKASDRYVPMSADHTRVVTLPVSMPTGLVVTVVDTSGSVTAGNTITFTATSGSITGTPTITPGTSTSTTLVHLGSNVWAVVAHV